MIDKLRAFFEAVPEHVWAILIIMTGAAVAVFHGLHTFEVGSSLTSAGLALYKGKQE
ncbi:hypothetical protein HNQ77_002685 [Silvibacterium bohemicum]|uniref:Uncharacterized protein n=1 Tax=Silvibacterium bohemicum TaxID=1577686 RepID=A0A841JYC4_9BACT|nr:hypothetical protein [Silvibacterium bohemicum]MBB6144729.1 hypothetical protein [Silvibacterium bohemicum]